MDARTQPSQTDIAALLAKVAEQDLHVRKSQAELEQFTQVIEEFQNSRRVADVGAPPAPVPATPFAAMKNADIPPR
jgi:uncharacterized coiled-coil protein SlyX